jgi:lipopolysaccharide transport system ATP-binding protein
MTTNGRIAALLELGSGFNPEFTGRENVYLNGAVLGLSSAEIDTRFDAIAAFAEVGEFIEQPVKTYSSGMMVRLAFAVAINVDPDILVVDEALSVGDERFQRKCFSRIEAIRSAGATILFVSHAGGTVVELCDRALLLDSGEQLVIGVPKKIVGLYQKLLYAPEEKREAIRAEIFQGDKNTVGLYQKPEEASGLNTKVYSASSGSINIEDELSDSFDPSLKPASTIAYESHGAIIHDPAIYTLDGEKVNNLTRGRSYRYRYRVEFERPASNVRFGMAIKTTSGISLGGATSAASVCDSLPFVTEGSSFEVEFEFSCRLNAGVYFLNAGVVGDVNGSKTFLYRLVDVAMFRVMPEANNLATGVVDFSCSTKIQLQSK